MDAEQAWQAALGCIEPEMSRARFKQYVQDTHGVSYDEGVFRIGVSDDAAREWLETHLASTARSHLRGILFELVEVEFVVGEGKREEALEEEEEAVESLPPGQFIEEEPGIDNSRPAASPWDLWTKLPKELVEKYGVMVAAVGGQIWSYCQMREGVCRASETRLAEELKLSRRTVSRAIRILIEGGYVIDLTPSLLHRPHRYICTQPGVVSGSPEKADRRPPSRMKTSSSWNSVSVTLSHTGGKSTPASATHGHTGGETRPASVTLKAVQCDSESLELNKNRKDKKLKETLAALESNSPKQEKESPEPGSPRRQLEEKDEPMATEINGPERIGEMIPAEQPPVVAICPSEPLLTDNEPIFVPDPRANPGWFVTLSHFRGYNVQTFSFTYLDKYGDRERLQEFALRAGLRPGAKEAARPSVGS